MVVVVAAVGLVDYSAMIGGKPVEATIYSLLGSFSRHTTTATNKALVTTILAAISLSGATITSVLVHFVLTATKIPPLLLIHTRLA